MRLTNKQFNQRIKTMFTKYSQDSQLIDACYRLWIKYELTDSQVDSLEKLKLDVYNNIAGSVYRYILPINQINK